MLHNIYKLLVMIMVITACNSNNKEKEINSIQFDTTSTEVGYSINRLHLIGSNFKVPVPQGYNWEITQSWGMHCEACDQKYGTDPLSFCDSSHTVLEHAVFSWDFSLPEDSDMGDSVLASADGSVKEIGKSKGWGNFVLLNHGNNICTRYAHMLDGSVSVAQDMEVCQGLKIGEIGKTGNVSGAHLHFQFEDCETHLPIEMGFTDGNGVPKCIVGNDIYTDGIYTALKLTNVEKADCSEVDNSQEEPTPPEQEPDPPQVCEMQCPMNEDCENKSETPFKDLSSSDSTTAWAVNYLWHECAVSGKSDGKFHKDDNLTRAEALKIALALFGLDKDCEGTLEPFTDVNPSQWFYPFVVCGVKYGVISKDNDHFNPEQEIYFSEAAKMAVESAVKANKAELKTGMYAKFLKLKSSDWSYKYLQTIAYYNGIDKDLLQYDPYEFVTRGEYARMITSLSPCYCYKNKCQGGCECNQSGYMCGQGQSTVSQDENPGSGQYGGGTGEQDAGSFYASTDGKDTQTCKPACYQNECGSDSCGGSCGTCPNDKFCSAVDGKCHYKCKVQSCEELGCECGKCAMTNPGCDGLSQLCPSCPEGQICNSANKCKADPCYNCPVGKCIGGQCLVDTQNWTCDPEKGFSVWIGSPGGQWSISHLIPGTDTYSFITVELMPMGYFMIPSIQGGCDELPMVGLIKGGPEGIKILVDEKNQPPIEVWNPYDGPLTFNPTTPPTLKTYYVDIATPNASVLVRIKAPVKSPTCK